MDTTAGLPPKFHYMGLESKFTEIMENFCIDFGSGHKFLLKNCLCWFFVSQVVYAVWFMNNSSYDFFL